MRHPRYSQRTLSYLNEAVQEANDLPAEREKKIAGFLLQLMAAEEPNILAELHSAHDVLRRYLDPNLLEFHSGVTDRTSASSTDALSLIAMRFKNCSPELLRFIWINGVWFVKSPGWAALETTISAWDAVDEASKQEMGHCSKNLKIDLLEVSNLLADRNVRPDVAVRTAVLICHSMIGRLTDLENKLTLTIRGGEGHVQDGSHRLAGRRIKHLSEETKRNIRAFYFVVLRGVKPLDYAELEAFGNKQDSYGKVELSSKEKAKRVSNGASVIKAALDRAVHTVSDPG